MSSWRKVPARSPRLLPSCRTGDAIYGYVALCSLAIVGVAILSGVLAVRHDLWWHVQRTLWVAGFLAMLVGLLSEYVNLLRRERYNLQQLQVSEAKFRAVFEKSAIGMGRVGFADALLRPETELPG